MQPKTDHECWRPRSEDVNSTKPSAKRKSDSAAPNSNNLVDSVVTVNQIEIGYEEKL